MELEILIAIWTLILTFVAACAALVAAYPAILQYILYRKTKTIVVSDILVSSICDNNITFKYIKIKDHIYPVYVSEKPELILGISTRHYVITYNEAKKVWILKKQWINCSCTYDNIQDVLNNRIENDYISAQTKDGFDILKAKFDKIKITKTIMGS